MAHGEAQTIINVIRQAVEQMTRKGAMVDMKRGIVHTGGAYLVSAYFDGENEFARTDIRMPAGAYVSPGDYIVVHSDGQGDAWVNEIMPRSLFPKMVIDPNAGKIYTGNGTTEPLTEFTGAVGNPNTGDFTTTGDIHVGDDLFVGDDIYLSDGLRWYAPGDTNPADGDYINLYRASATELGMNNYAATGGMSLNIFGRLKESGLGVLSRLRKNSTGSDYQRGRLNLIEGTNVTITVADDAVDDEVDVTIAAPAFASPTIALGSSASAGAASSIIRSDATIAAFDATAPSTQAFGDSATVGSAAFAARRDHKHAMPANPVTAHEATVELHGIGCKLVKTATQSVNNTTDTAVTFGSGTESWDPHGWHDTTTNTSRVTPNVAGYMTVIFAWSFASHNTGERQAWIEKNGVTIYSEDRVAAAAGGSRTSGCLTATMYFNGTTDYVVGMVRQNSGGALNLVGDERVSLEVIPVGV